MPMQFSCTGDVIFTRSKSDRGRANLTVQALADMKISSSTHVLFCVAPGLYVESIPSEHDDQRGGVRLVNLEDLSLSFNDSRDDHYVIEIFRAPPDFPSHKAASVVAYYYGQTYSLFTFSGIAPAPFRNGATFCSELVANILKDLNVELNKRAHSTTPSALLRRLSRLGWDRVRDGYREGISQLISKPIGNSYRESTIEYIKTSARSQIELMKTVEPSRAAPIALIESIGYDIEEDDDILHLYAEMQNEISDIDDIDCIEYFIRGVEVSSIEKIPHIRNFSVKNFQLKRQRSNISLIKKVKSVLDADIKNSTLALSILERDLEPLLLRHQKLEELSLPSFKALYSHSKKYVHDVSHLIRHVTTDEAIKLTNVALGIFFAREIAYSRYYSAKDFDEWQENFERDYVVQYRHIMLIKKLKKAVHLRSKLYEQKKCVVRAKQVERLLFEEKLVESSGRYCTCYLHELKPQKSEEYCAGSMIC